jgi:uncharacterized protein YjbI with pentapeptide repeats
MKIANNVKSYSVKILDESIEINGRQFAQTAIVILRDQNHNMIQKQKMGIVDNEELYKKIAQKIPVDLSYCYVKNFSIQKLKQQEQVAENGTIVLKDFNAENAFFESDKVTDFSNIHFEGEVTNFKNAHFGLGNLTFAKSHFKTSIIDFSYTSYSEGDTNFSFCEFTQPKGRLTFENANFISGTISFVSVHFDNDQISFKNAQFGQSNLSMKFSIFTKGLLLFDKTTFKGEEVDFSKVNFNKIRVDFKRTNFSNANLIFDESASVGEKFIFRKCTFLHNQISFKSADLGQSEIVFDESQFGGGNISFLSLTAHKLSLNNCSLSINVDARVEKCEEVHFNNAICRDLVDFNIGISSVNISLLSFYGMRNLGQILIDWEDNSVQKMIENQKLTTTAQQKADQYRILKESFNKLGLYDDEDKAYVQFKRNELKDQKEKSIKAKSFIGLIKYYIKKLVFDKMGLFATSPIRVFISTCFVFAFFSLLYFIISLFGGASLTCTNPDMSLLDQLFESFYFSAVTFLTIGYGECVPQGFFKSLAPAEAYCGIFMISYFVVSFVRKVLR